jgi:hypothetical protein
VFERGGEGFARFGVPDSGRIVEVRGDDPPAVGGERRRPDRVLVFERWGEGFARPGVPDSGRVAARGDNTPAVGGERRGQDPILVFERWGEWYARPGVPDSGRVAARGDNTPAVGGERRGKDPILVFEGGLSDLPVPASQTKAMWAWLARAIWSLLVVTTRRPSGANDADRTPSLCSSAGVSGLLVSASQIRAVPSALAVTIRRPSGANDAELTDLL